MFVCSLNYQTDLNNDIVTIGAINNISLMLPSFSPLTQPEDVKDEMFCNKDNRPQTCVKDICTCVHRIKVKLNSIVEITVVDVTAGDNH